MKKGTKITLIILAVLFGIAALIFVGADIAVSRIAQKEVNKALAEIPGCQASCGTIKVRFFSATAQVNDLRFTYHGEPIHAKDTVGPGVDIWVERVDVGRFFYTKLLKKEVLISSVSIVRPHAEIWLDEEKPESCFPELHDEKLEQADNVLLRAALNKLKIKNASMRLHSVRTKLDVEVDSCSLTVHDLAYDSTFSYNDSVYHFSLEYAGVTIPDGQMRIETSDIHHDNQGALLLGRTRIRHTMPRKKLGEMVKEPVTWMDMTIESVQTTPFNPIHKAMAKDFNLEGVKAVVEKMDIFRDERFAPKKPFDMPQQILTAIPVVFNLKYADTQIKKIDIEFASTDINIGKLQLKDIQARVDNITNKRNATMMVKGSCPIEQGQALAEMTMTMNKDCEFTTKLHAVNINADFLNSFVRPLVGITCECQIDTLDTEYKGNTTIAKGTYRMLYNGLNVQVHKEDNIPYKIVTNHAKTFTSLANSLIPKSNPTAVDIHPRAYYVEWKRDEWKPFPLYMFGPCIDGVKMTFLPGLYVHKQVH